MKVDDIRPDTLRAGQQAAMYEDIALLNSWRSRFVEVDCPACAGRDSGFAFELNGLHYRQCPNCDSQFMSPRPTSDMLAEFYAVSKNYTYWAKYIYPASAQARRDNIFRPRAQMTLDLCQQRGTASGTFVEVGSGYGIFCEEICRAGIFDRIIGIEPSPNLAQLCRDKGIEVIEKPFEQIDMVDFADLVASFEVIEHLFAPRDFVAWMSRLLKPGGIAMLTCPNIHGLDTLMLGRDAVAVDHQHLNYFHPRSLRNLFETNDFADIEITTPGKLDVDLLRRARQEGSIDDARLGPFLTKIIAEANSVTDGLFQRFLQDAGLSSNMMIVARKA